MRAPTESLRHRQRVSPSGQSGCRDAPGRRKTPHTTHHQDLPERVTITRSHHPFETKALEVLGTIHRKGQLYLVLILPDGSKSMIPAEWTDFASATQPQRPVSDGAVRHGAFDVLEEVARQFHFVL